MPAPRSGRQLNMKAFLAALVGGYVGVQLGILAPAGALRKAAAPQQPQQAEAPVTGGGEFGGGSDLVALVKRVVPAVVSIDTVSTERVGVPMFRDPFTGEAFGPLVPSTQQRRGVGSGFVLDGEHGLIVTNNHVVQGATVLRVTWQDGERASGRVLAREPRADLAFVKVDLKKPHPALPLADKPAEVGQPVLAVGSPLGLSYSVSAGIVSASGRTVGESPVGFLQTDTAINPGNSGGPLISFDGRVVGVNTAIARDAQGIGFAIPASVVADLVAQLE